MTVASVSEIPGTGSMLADHSLLAGIHLIAINPRLLAVQQLPQHVRIVHVGCGRCHGVDQLGPAVRTDMQLHAEIPLPALAGLAHLWITRLSLVLGRTRCGDDGRIDDCPPFTCSPRDER